MQLVIDCEVQNIIGGLFEEDQLVQTFQVQRPEELLPFLKGKTINQGLVAGDSNNLMAWIAAQGLPCKSLATSEFKQLATDETFPLLQPHQIANIYGALSLFPSNDCVIVDIGVETNFSYVTKQGVYLGGTRFPAILSEGSSILGKTKLDQEKGGNYFGLLGAIERIVAELRLTSETPSAVMSIATGKLSEALQKNLEDFIDKVDPELTLKGLNQILKEGKK